uniref:Synaptobrevin, longin-like domain protein n=1 Tax=Tanacetum cinerariifolium TaxID=118510 RepID=A0A699JF88_TANCI|nr:hypothetical protein [Tanacetum cinerariifolium]
MEATIRDALRLDDAEGIECLPNEEIFAELAIIGYEKPSSKLTFYKAFFLSHLVRNVDSPTKFYMYPRFLQFMIGKQVGDLSSHSTKYTSPAMTQKEVGKDADEVYAEDVNAAGVVVEGAASEDVNVAVDEPSIPSPPPPTPPQQPSQDIPSTSQVLSMHEKESEPAKIQEVVDVVTTANIITKVVTAASDTITTASTTITAVDVPIPAATIAAAPTLTAAPSRRRKGVTKEQMDEEDSRALKRLNESYEEKAAKKQKLDEEVEELKRHIQIMPNDEDDVYTEATPLARKIPIVDYEIYNENNKLYFKIKRVDGLHQLYLSFLSMLRNFDREDLEVLWKLVKERFATTKPKNFSDDFLLITLGAIFEKPDIQAQI